MKLCRECKHEISEQALQCPHCGAPHPSNYSWDGWGFEYRSKMLFFKLPLIHISFKYRPNRMPVPAKGIIAIGQFATGFITIGQFGIGIVSISQFGLALYALAQIGIAYSLIAQIGLYVHWGFGQTVHHISTLFP